MVENILEREVFIYPTDTVWGIGASIYSNEANDQIAIIKKMPEKRPVSILFNDLSMIRDYFFLPLIMTDVFLENFFSLESTLAIPLLYSRKQIPPWINVGSDLVAIRCLKLQGVDIIINKTKCPITTTSLNISGEPSILTKEDAVCFAKKYASNATVVFDESSKMSGSASSILSCNLNGDIRFLRRGRFADELEKHIRLLSA